MQNLSFAKIGLFLPEFGSVTAAVTIFGLNGLNLVLKNSKTHLRFSEHLNVKWSYNFFPQNYLFLFEFCISTARCQFLV
jgi:hypothetical protein